MVRRRKRTNANSEAPNELAIESRINAIGIKNRCLKLKLKSKLRHFVLTIERRKRTSKMVEDKGFTTNAQLKSFDGSKASFRSWITYFNALVMVKNFSDVVLPEFKSELPATNLTIHCISSE